ncbi:MAG: PKD domain-containing protein, partial [Pseudomonadales bacterium]
MAFMTYPPMYLQRAARALTWITLCILAACGGGGGSSGPPPNQAPTASIEATPVSGEVPLTVDFDASGSADNDGNITTYAWDFGNGETATGITTQTTYDNTGNFVVTLEVADDDGATDSTTRIITVTEPTFSLSGSIRILSGSEVDVDTNDTNTTDGDNDDFDTAQPIGNPANVGGYVTESGAGENGLVSTEGDVSDFYRFTSVGGETILLTIGDASPSNDLDLRLYDEDRELKDESLGTDQTESFEIPGPGQYFVEVTAFDGASTYILALGQTQTSTQNHLRLSSSFVPGEILLGLPRKDQTASGELKGRASGLNTVSSNGWRHGPQVVRLPATTHRGDRLAAMDAEPRRIPGAALSESKLERLDTLHAIKLLRREGRYAYAEPNYIRHASRVPEDSFFNRQWHYRNIKLEQAWELSIGSSDVVVGVIDTGVLLEHPDLSGRLTDDGFDFISDADRALDDDGIDPDPNDPGDRELGDRSSFHGTHVAGTVAAQTDN